MKKKANKMVMNCYHCKQKFEIKKAKDCVTCPHCQTKTYIMQCSQCGKRVPIKKPVKKCVCKKCREKHSKPATEKQPIEKRAVFISYAHEDEKWLNEIKRYLKFYEEDGLTVWTDQELRAGDQWNNEIETAIKHASVSILLISIDFFNSDFIMKEEMPRILEQFNKNTMRVIPVIVSACSWQKKTWLSQFQVLPDGATPLEQCKKKSEVMTAVAEEIFAFVQFQPQEIKAKSYGSGTYRMCNRIPQVLTFSQAYQVHAMPQFYFIHGKEQDNHQSLVDRYNQTIIQKRINEISESTELPYEFKYTFNQDAKKLHDQQEYMLYELFYLLTDNSNHNIKTFEDLVSQEVFKEYRAIIISHEIEERLFNNDLMTAYIQDFWIKGYSNYVKTNETASLPQFILFFNIVYKTGIFRMLTSRKKKIINYINGFTPKNKTCVLIPELEPVTKNHVLQWFNSYSIDLKDNEFYKTKMNECIKQLFPKEKGRCPMDVVENQLKLFSNQFNLLGTFKTGE